MQHLFADFQPVLRIRIAVRGCQALQLQFGTVAPG